MVGTPNHSRIVSCKPRLSGMERPVLWCGLDVNDTSEGAKIVVDGVDHRVRQPQGCSNADSGRRWAEPEEKPSKADGN